MAENRGLALRFIDDVDAPFSQRLAMVSKPLAPLNKGEVRVKVLASPVNPSDLVYLRGQYGVPPADAAFAGFEGCGVVVAANAGLYGKWLLGKRVAIAATPGADGVWAEYVTTLASYCLPVRKDIDDVQASTLIVNPCTVVCLLARAKEIGTQAVVINAAASQVGKGLIRLAKMQGVKTICTVRSQANVAVLRELGADAVLLTTDEDYPEQLKALAHEWRARVLLDAVADMDTPSVLRAMPAGSTAIVYGRLQETRDPLGGRFSVADVIFRRIKIEGFWLADFMKKASPLKVLSVSRQVQKLFAEGVFHTDIRGEYGFDDFMPALEHYAEHKSDGKVILRPQQA